ncbi:MAG TPA: c-type cytochrome [Candidatus Dormibacteraeota bacterium]|nr:c-type cytochrome [Candidatus Dormibacteraeota bacterium]
MRRMAVVILMLGMAAPAFAGVDAQEFYNKKCKVCHELKGVAGPKAKVGGKLDGIGAKHDEAWFRAYLTDPKSQKPDSKMKKINMSPEELDAMAQFMSQQK